MRYCDMPGGQDRVARTGRLVRLYSTSELSLGQFYALCMRLLNIDFKVPQNPPLAATEESMG